jgi:hypothetical protein
VNIPLPARYLITDDAETQRRQSVEAMESLAEALLRFAIKLENDGRMIGTKLPANDVAHVGFFTFRFLLGLPLGLPSFITE